MRLTLLSVAVLMGSGSAAAFASEPAAPDRSAAASVRESDTYYEMHLTATSATVHPGGATTTFIAFDASRSLYGAPVDLSASGLPNGVAASFSPRRPPVGGYSTMTLTTTSSSVPGAFTITIGAIINVFPSDPIGTTATFELTIAANPTQTSTTDASARTGVAPAALTYYTFGNREYAQCADTPKRQLNEILRLANCTLSDSQVWTLVPVPGTSDVYNIVNKATNLCVEVNNGTSIPGERVDAWICNGLASEQWRETSRMIDGLPWRQFEHVGTGLCLDTVGGPNSQLMQWYCGSDNDAQTWLVYRAYYY